MVGVVVEFVCLQDLTLKVSGQYLNFWLSYKGSPIKWLTCQSRVERESSTVIIMVASPDAEVGQEAVVGQGLPNIRNIETIENSSLGTGQEWLNFCWG